MLFHSLMKNHLTLQQSAKTTTTTAGDRQACSRWRRRGHSLDAAGKWRNGREEEAKIWNALQSCLIIDQTHTSAYFHMHDKCPRVHMDHSRAALASDGHVEITSGQRILLYNLWQNVCAALDKKGNIFKVYLEKNKKKKRLSVCLWLITGSTPANKAAKDLLVLSATLKFVWQQLD